MNKQEIALRNLGLGFEFDKYLLERPEILEKIPENALLVLLPQDDPELAQANMELAEKGREPGQPVVHVVIKALDPHPRSRVLDAEVSLATPETPASPHRTARVAESEAPYDAKRPRKADK